MLPLMLDIQNKPVAIIGNGYAATMRLRLVDQSGADTVRIFAVNPTDELRKLSGPRLVEHLPTDSEFECAGFKVVYIGDMAEEEASSLVEKAHRAGALVNVHDIKALCDFHVPARLVRGDLQITVSTNGRAAGLSRILRDHLANRVFGPDWAAKVSSLGQARDSWRASGASFDELVRRTETFINDRGWLSRKSKSISVGREG